MISHPTSGNLYGLLEKRYVTTGSAGTGYGLNIYNAAGTLKVRAEIANTTPLEWTFTAATLPIETWHHLLCTCDGVNIRLYVNNINVATVAHTGAVSRPSTPLNIGVTEVNTGDYSRGFNGFINHVGLWGRGVSKEEVNVLYADPNQLFRKQPIWYTPTDVTTDITQTSIYRIEVTTDKTQSSTWSIYGTTDKTQSSTYRIEATTDKTQSSVWAIGDVVTDKTQDSVYRIEATTDKTQSSIWSIYGSTDKTQSSIYRIQTTSDKDQYSTWAIAGIGTLSLIFIDDIDEAYTPYIIDENFHRVKRFAEQTKIDVALKATTVYVDSKVDDTAIATSWNGETTEAPSKNAVVDAFGGLKLVAHGSVDTTSVEGGSGYYYETVDLGFVILTTHRIFVNQISDSAFPGGIAGDRNLSVMIQLATGGSQTTFDLLTNKTTATRWHYLVYAPI